MPNKHIKDVIDLDLKKNDDINFAVLAAECKGTLVMRILSSIDKLE